MVSPTPPETPKLGSTGVITGLIPSRFESQKQAWKYQHPVIAGMEHMSQDIAGMAHMIQGIAVMELCDVART